MSRKVLAYTIVNTLFVVVGVTTLILAAEDHQRKQEEIKRSEGFLLFRASRRFEWQRTIQSGIRIGMGLIMSIVGVVRQVDVERHARNANDATPRVLYSGLLMGTFVALSNSERGSRNNGEQYEDEADNSEEHDCDDSDDGDENWNVVFPTEIVVRPAEDDSVGADPVKRSINRGNSRIIIRNDIMFTIRDVVNSFNARDGTIPVDERTNNEIDGGGDDCGDVVYQHRLARFPVEQQSLYSVSNLEDSNSAQ